MGTLGTACEHVAGFTSCCRCAGRRRTLSLTVKMTAVCRRLEMRDFSAGHAFPRMYLDQGHAATDAERGLTDHLRLGREALACLYAAGGSITGVDQPCAQCVSKPPRPAASALLSVFLSAATFVWSRFSITVSFTNTFFLIIGLFFENHCLTKNGTNGSDELSTLPNKRNERDMVIHACSFEN